MARVIYAAHGLADLERLADLLLDADPASAAQTVDFIVEAVEVLGNHPMIGRPVEENLGELVISQGRSGYLALYSYEAEHDVVLVLAIRHQREVGFEQE